MCFVSCDRASRLCASPDSRFASPDSLYGVLRRCGSAGGKWAHSWRESAREARLDLVSGALRVTFVGAVASGVALLGAVSITRVGRVVFTRGELTCCSRARMLVVKYRWRSCVGRVMIR